MHTKHSSRSNLKTGLSYNSLRLTQEELFQDFTTLLLPIYGDGELRSICRILFEDLVVKSDFDMKELPALKARLAKQEPVQYILGEADFYSLKYKVSPAVLIPRQETEELVALFRDHHKKSSTAAILDIGTGSGCIPITIKYSHPRTTFTAIDVSEEALAIAQFNADRHQQKIDLKVLDFCNIEQRASLASYDVIISNPPYIGQEEADKLEQNVIAYEPHVALFSPEKDANYFYRLIYDFSKDHLNLEGRVYLELNEYNAQEVRDIFEQGGFDEVKIVKDIHQKDRILYAKR